MGMYRRNVTAAVENKIQEDHPKTGKREKDYLRSLIFLFIIVAIAATVAEITELTQTIVELELRVKLLKAGA